MSKRYPVQCIACKRKATKQYAVFDMITLNHKKFVLQHLNGPTHVKNAAKLQGSLASASSGISGKAQGPQGAQLVPAGEQGDQEGGAEDNIQVNCGGFNVRSGPESARLVKLADACDLWASYSILHAVKHLGGEDATNHSYTIDLNSGSLIIRHRSCAATVSCQGDRNEPAMCHLCAELGSSRPIIRMVLRFYMKHTAARLLAARFFEPDQVPVMMQQIKDGRQLDEIFELNQISLQNFVRSQFLSVPSSKWCLRLRDFMSSVVFPCLKVPASSWNGQVANPAGSVRVRAEKLRNGDLSSVAEIDLKLACHVASGALRQHPIVQGILVAAIEQSQRARRGSSGFRGHKLSELELSMMSEAGVSIAMAASNTELIRQFGLAFRVPKLSLHNMHACNLPDAFLAQTELALLQQNCLIIGNHLATRRDASESSLPSGRRPTLAFDKTYILKGLDVVQFRGGRAYLGTAFDPDAAMSARRGAPQTCSKEDGNKGFLLLRTNDDNQELQEPQEDDQASEQLTWDAADLNYAQEMLEFLIWDPAVKGLPRFSACCIPTSYESSAMHMLHLVGQVLQGASQIRTIAFDNATQHGLIKAMLLGQKTGLSPDELRGLPFWSRISYVPFPESALPRFPFNKPSVDGEILFGLNGPAHLQKNMAGQCRSPSRTIAFGQFFTDFSGCLDLCMPPAAFQSYDGQSDAEAASFFNAFHYVADLVTDVREVRVPWSLVGAVLVNLTSCLTTSSVFHPGSSDL